MTQATGNDHPRVIVTINQAIELVENDQALAAIQLLVNLVAEFPKSSSVHGYLGWYLSGNGKHEDAIAHTQEAVRLSPNSELASLIHFHALWDADQQVEALGEMRRFLKIRPLEEYANILREWTPRMKPDEK